MMENTKNNIATIFVIIAICFSLMGCNHKKGDDYTVDDGMFVGTYYLEGHMSEQDEKLSNADAKMTIVYDGDIYKIELKLAGFGDVSCVGNRKNNYLPYSGINDFGQSFCGKMEFKGDYIINLELWNEDGYLPAGDKSLQEFLFYKVQNVDELINRINGYWLFSEEDDVGFDAVHIFGDNIETYSHPLEWGNPCKISKVEKNNDGYEITVCYKEDEGIPSQEKTIKVRSNDDFTKTMTIVHDELNREHRLQYIGPTYDDINTYCWSQLSNRE